MKRKLTAFILLLCLVLSGCEYGVVFEEQPGTPGNTTQTQAPTNGDGDTLLVHFIDVGQADCALIEYGEHFVLIDGGNVEDGQMVVSYLEQQGVEELDAVISTHAHEDHVGGLPSVLAVYPTRAVYAATRTYASNVYDDFLYYVDQQGLEAVIPAPGDRIRLGELTLTVLGPVESYAETNDTSIIVRVDFGGTSFLFTGDMETAAESDMLDYWGEDMDWNVDVLKVGHHGSDTSTGYRFLNAVMPTYGVISVGEGNSYGHPCESTLSLLGSAGVTVLRTDELGTIIAASDGEEVSFTWEDQSAQPSDVEPGESVTYIGNVNSKKFHSPDCGALPKEENRIYFDSYEEAIEAGYTPCSSCLD